MSWPQWGHQLIAPADHEAIAEAVFVGLPEGERWLGICRVEPGRRLIDGPGFPDWPGDTAARQALVLGAGALLGGGPATLETWGDQAEPYLAVGCQVADECPGWELLLPNQLHSAAERSSLSPGMALTWDDARWTSPNVAG